jgi:hypothetical protein
MAEKPFSLLIGRMGKKIPCANGCNLDEKSDLRFWIERIFDGEKEDFGGRLIMNFESSLVEYVRIRYQAVEPFLDELGRRIWAGAEVLDLGYGGAKVVHQATNLALKTIRRGVGEAASMRLSGYRQRRQGSGRKPLPPAAPPKAQQHSNCV